MKSIYYLPYSNFGDELPPYLIEKITGRKDLTLGSPPPFTTPTLVTVGSILDLNMMNENSIIWGTGTLDTKCLTLPRVKFFPISKLYRQIRKRSNINQPDIRAVRGPRTREMLLRLGLKCPAIYGDPAILLPKFYMPKPLGRRFPIGLVLHHSHHLTVGQVKFCSQQGILPIPIIRKGKEDIENIIDEICSCDRIFASSLHGLIVAQAYGVPAQWIKVSRWPIHKDDWHKFEDYFLGSGQDIQNAIEIDLSEKGIRSLVKFDVTDIKPFNGVEPLLDAFPTDFF